MDNVRKIMSIMEQIEYGLLLDEIFIQKEYRDKGLGSSIIKNYVLNNDDNIYLWVYKDNIKAINLYNKIGFKVREETDTRYYVEYIK